MKTFIYAFREPCLIKISKKDKLNWIEARLMNKIIMTRWNRNIV